MSHWRDRAIEKSQAISDAWDVAKAYAGRAAEWVLFGCMFVNILEMLPGNIIPAAVANGILAVQAITLDVAGFGLQSLADHAERLGDERASRVARRTGTVLISIMILTLVSVTLPLLWPVLSAYTGLADKVLILVRVVMTVIYGHVMHSLRQYAEVQTQRELEEVRAQVQHLQDELAQARTNSEQVANRLSELLAQIDEQKTNTTNELSALKTNMLSEISLRLGEHKTNILDELSASFAGQIEHLQSAINVHGQTHEALSALQKDVRRLEQEAKAKNEQVNEQQPAPNVRYLRPKRTKTNEQNEHKTNVPNEKGSFVRWCLTENPTMRNSEIQRKASEHGLTVSPGYISDIRKAMGSEAVNE